MYIFKFSRKSTWSCAKPRPNSHIRKIVIVCYHVFPKYILEKATSTNHNSCGFLCARCSKPLLNLIETSTSVMAWIEEKIEQWCNKCLPSLPRLFSWNCYSFCYRFAIVLVAESWSTFWDKFCFQWHSQLPCRKRRVERINSVVVNVKVSEFKAELEHEVSFNEVCYCFFILYMFSVFQPTADLRHFGHDSYKSNRTGYCTIPRSFDL